MRSRELFNLLSMHEKEKVVKLGKLYWRFVREAFSIFTYDETIVILQKNGEMSFVVHEQNYVSHFADMDPYKVMNGNCNMRLHNAIGIRRTFLQELEMRLNNHFDFTIATSATATSTSFTITIKLTRAHLPPKKKYLFFVFFLFFCFFVFFCIFLFFFVFLFTKIQKRIFKQLRPEQELNLRPDD